MIAALTLLLIIAVFVAVVAWLWNRGEEELTEQKGWIE